MLPQAICCNSYMFTIASMMIFFSGICTYISALVDDLDTMMLEINEKSKPLEFKLDRRIELQNCVKKLIEFHKEILGYL